MIPFGCPVTILNTLDPLDPQNTNDDATFEVKEPEFEIEKPESEVHVSPSNRFRNLNEEFEDFADNSINEVNAASTTVLVVGKISTNSTNTFSAAGPSNTVIAPSFVQPTDHVKTPRPSVKPVEHPIPAANLKTDIPKPKAMEIAGIERHVLCYYARMTHPNPHRHVVPTAVLTRSKLVPLTAARPVTTAVPYNNVTRQRPAKTVVTKPHSPPRRIINHRPSPPASNFPPKVTTGNPQHALKDKGVIDSGCSRHMTGNMSYLTDFEEINGGYVAFGGNPKGGKITGKCKIRIGKLDFDDVYFVKELKFNLFSVSQMCDKKNSVLFIDTECIVLSSDFKLPDENQVLLRVPRENNMYNVDLKNIVPSGDLTCLFAKATLYESNLWHRRLGHINFKTMNKLVKDNLVRGLPSKVFENNHTCFACKKGKQHRASCKTKPNTDDDATFKVKEPEFKFEKPESEVYVSPSSSAKTKKHDDRTKREVKGKSPVELSTGFRNLSQEFEVFSDNNINEVNAASTSVPAVGQISTNSTNIFSAAGPSNTVVSPTLEKYSYVDTSQYPDDPNMPDLEDITYSDDEEYVGTEADFSNMETTITVSPIPTTRFHKDHPMTQIIGDLSTATQTRKEVYVCQPPGFEDPDYPKKKGKIDQALFIKKKKSDILLVQVYVDDIIFSSTNKDLCKAFEKLMKDKFQMSLMGELTFFLVAFSDSDYAGASLDRKSTTGGCQFLRCRLISWQCKKQTVVATSSNEAEYVATASCCAQDDEPKPAELKEVTKVVTTTKLMTEVVIAATTPITIATITVAPSAAKRRKGIVIRDLEETVTPSTIVHSEPKSKDKEKGIFGMSYDAIHLIFEKYFNLNVAFLEKSKEQLEEKESRALKRQSESSKEKAAKKKKLDEKVPVVDYEIHTENNKPYYKIIRADGSHQLFLSFLSLLRNFDREDLEMLWQIVQERFASSKPNNFLDDFLLTTLKAMFEKPDVEAQVLKNQRGIHGLAKVKS
nr:ribonuclease H-like domain-containing protein [Tanacetum cinerariifolium]